MRSVFVQRDIDMNARRGYGIGIFWFVTLLLVGCVGLGPGGGVVWRFDDPPGLSPYARPLNGAPSDATQQSVTKPDSSSARPNGPSIAGGSPTRGRGLEAPEPRAPRTNSAGRPPVSPTPAPAAPQESPNDPPLQLDVAAPEFVVTDDPASLRLTLRNRTSRAAENVTVSVRFGAAWQFPGSDQRDVTEELGRIEPDAERGLTVSLWGREPGRQTVELVVKSDTHAEVGRTISIDVRPRIVDIQMVGPAERTVGSRAEYILTLVNVSRQAQPDTQVDIAYGEALLLKEVSAGVDRTPGKLTWDLGELLPDERIEIQIEFECASAAARSCLRVEVHGRDFQPQQREVCLQIAEKSDVDLQISDAADPIEVMESTTYTIRVANGGRAPQRGVTLHLTPTEQIEIESVQARTGSGNLAMETSPGADGWTVVTKEDLPPAGTWAFEVRVRAREIGAGQLIALLKAEGLTPPLMVREMTVVDPPVVRQE